MATLWKAPTANFVTTTLNGSIDNSTTSIVLNSTTGMQFPGYIVIDRVDTSNTSTPNAREVVSFTGISSNTLTGCTRGADTSTARSHSDGAIVETMPTIGMWNELYTAVSSALTADGVVKAIVSPVSIARGEFIQFALSSNASVRRIEGINGAFSSVVSIAQVQSNTYAGAKGHFLWIQSGALTTSLATSTNTSQIPFLRATKNLTINSVYMGLNSAASLGPVQVDIYYKSTPTGTTGTSIFSVRPLVGIGLNDNLSGSTIGTLNLTSLASGVLLYPELRQPNGGGDMTLQLIATERP